MIYLEKKNLTKKIVIGADEAGRGLIIGPMVIGACAIDDDIKIKFEDWNIRDSKSYSSLKRLQEHTNLIKGQALAFDEQVITAKVLTNFNKEGLSMDVAEAYAFYKAIENISKKVKDIHEIQVDNFQAKGILRKQLKSNEKLKNVKLIILPKADSKYIAVGAGSILARYRAITELSKLKEKYGNFGSGSTSDKRTIAWLKKYYSQNKSWPDIVRTYWKTIDRIEKEIK
jgi:ribonuclease HII